MLKRCLVVPAIVCVAFLAGCDGKLTTSNYEMVKPGMTLSSVLDILGQGERQTQSGASRIANEMVGGIPGAGAKAKESTRDTYLWKTDKVEITVIFEDGLVIQKNQMGL